MPTLNFTNQKSSQSLRGQAVLVTLNSTDSGSLYRLSAGLVAVNASSAKTGTVGRIDVYGHSFLVNPIQPDRDFASASVYGYLAINETVYVYI